MRDIASTIADEILGRFLIKSSSAYSVLHRELVARLAREYEFYGSSPEFWGAAMRIIADVVGAQSQVHKALLADMNVIAFLHGTQSVVFNLPPMIAPALVGTPPTATGTITKTIRFPKIEAARNDLIARKLMTAPEFYAIQDRASRNAAFAFSGLDREAAGVVRDVLAEGLQNSPSLGEFKSKLDELNVRSPLGPSHLETVYRVGMQSSLSAGQNRILANPVLTGVFPYRDTRPIRDSRLTSLCLIMAKSGIDRSNIYLAEDPVWVTMGATPRHFNCRCSSQPLTIREAARKGIQHAIEWLDSGENPSWSAFVPQPTLDADAQKTWDSWNRYRLAA